MADRKISRTLPLARPVRLGDELIEQLEFEDLCVEHLWDLKQDAAMGDLYALAARACGQPLKVMKRLGLQDGAEVLKLIVEQLRPFQEIGALLSEPSPPPSGGPPVS